MASGLPSVTNRELPRRALPLRAAHTCFRFDFRLATPNNSLTLASRRKTRHCLIHVAYPVTQIRFHKPTL